MNKSILFRIVILLNVTAALVFLGATAYLGTFSRYIADDYCESYSVAHDSPVGAVINRYMNGQWRASNRFTNLLFVGFADKLIPDNIATLPSLMFILWVIGLVWAIYEGRTLVGMRWPILIDFCLGTLLAFLPIFEAPNRFQTFYWRSSMATHFAPLVFLNFLIALLFLRVRLTKGQSAPLWIGFIFFLASFFIGGFSEPPLTLIIIGAGVSLLYVWFFITGEARHPTLNLLSWILSGGICALIVMALSPSVAHLHGSPSFFEWVQRTTQYTYFFLTDTLKTLPLPTLYSLVVPAIVIFVLAQEKEYSYLTDTVRKRNIFYLAVAAPLFLTLLIAAGFSTSAFGQAYPVDRARFFAHFLWVATFMFEGMLLGIWLSQIKSLVFRYSFILNILILILFIMAYYPLRAEKQILQDESLYRTRAQLWDERDTQIHLLIAQGKSDLVVPQLDGIYGVKELDVYADHWINGCANLYYGIHSIRAISVK